MHSSLLEKILSPGALRTVVQPIVWIDGAAPRTIAYEFLTRGPAGTNLEGADALFEYVRLKRVEPLVDRACVEAALITAADCGVNSGVSLNVHATTLARDARFASFLIDRAESAGIAPARIVVEIIEHAWSHEGTPVHDAINALRAAGAHIAIDDVGLGHANYQMILEVRPDYFKIDRYFIEGCHSDPHRLAVISSIQQLARDLGGVVIAEGVEQERDYHALLARGLKLFQGFLFGRPAAPAARQTRELRESAGC